MNSTCWVLDLIVKLYYCDAVLIDRDAEYIDRDTEYIDCDAFLIENQGLTVSGW